MSKAGRRMYEAQVKYWSTLLRREMMYSFQQERKRAYTNLRVNGLLNLSIRRREFFVGNVIERRLKMVMEQALRDAAQQQRDALSKRKSKSFDISDLIQDFMTNFFISTVVRAIIERFRSRYYTWIDDAIARNLSPDEAQAEFRKINMQDKIAAANIARVEASRAVNVGSRFAAQTFPYKLQKQWIAVGDIRTRGLEPNDKADHWDLSGEIMPEDMPFRDPRSGSLLMHPMDMSLGAKLQDVINCRCHVEYEVMYDAFGVPIPK